MKILKAFVFFGLLNFSCSEKEEPQTVYGDYLPISITADKSVDITGEGEASTDLFEQLRSSGEFFDKTTGIIFLRLYSPEYFNTGFPQVVFQLPYHFQNENSVIIDYHFDGRRYSLTEDGTFGLLWNTASIPFDTPEQFQDNIVIESLKFNQTQETLELVVAQRLFDYSIDDWIEAEVTYSLVKEN